MSDRRIRFYRRQTPGPTKAARRLQLALGFSWCRRCTVWLPVDAIRSGLCREHRNEEYRRSYAAGGKLAIRARVYARKRKTGVLPVVAREVLMEKFGGRCAYCPEPATTFDHIEPVVRGGKTLPGNIVPACVSCNSSKKAKPLYEWLRGREHLVSDHLFDILSLSQERL